MGLQVRQAGTLGRLGLHFDVFFSERSLVEGGGLQRVLADLDARGRLLDVAMRLSDAVPCGALSLSLRTTPWASLGEPR